MFFEANGEARAYPLAILIWHEIVNDDVAGQKVALTFCPLCNSTIAFNSVLEDGTVLDFGTSGNLRNSDLVMYDRQTRSWWQQFTGEAIVGQPVGEAGLRRALLVRLVGFPAGYDRLAALREIQHIRSQARHDRLAALEEALHASGIAG